MSFDNLKKLMPKSLQKICDTITVQQALFQVTGLFQNLGYFRSS